MNRKLKNEELSRKSVKEYRQAEKSPIAVILDNVRSLNNIGSVFRSCDAFLVEKLLLCGITAQPPHRDIQKTALGATESVPWKYYKTTAEAITALREEGYLIVGVEQTEKSISLKDFYPEEESRTALVFGHEVKGIQQETVNLCDLCLEIPQHGTKHSLNISVAAGIVIWEVFSKVRG